MTGTKISIEIFDSSIAIDGRMKEMDEKQRKEYVKELFNNTKTLLDYGVTLPVKEGHNQKDELLHGKILDVMLLERDGRTVLAADVFLDDQYYSLYNEGRLPDVSVETAPMANLDGFTGKDTEIGAHVYALALLGSSSPAKPQLRKVEGFPDQPHAIYERQSDARTYKKSKEKKDMKDKIKALFEAFQSGINGLFESDNDPQKTDEPPDPTDPDKMCNTPKKKKKMNRDAFAREREEWEAERKEEREQMQNQLDELHEMNLKSSYERLSKEGRVTAEQEKNFFTIAREKGVVFAENVYATKIVDVPQGSIISTPETMTKANNDRIYQACLDSGASEEVAKKVAENMIKKGEANGSSN